MQVLNAHPTLWGVTKEPPETDEERYRVKYGDLARSTRWRRFIEDLRGPDGELPPTTLVKSAGRFIDPTEWLESLGLDHEMSFYEERKNGRWLAFVRASLGPPAALRPISIDCADPATSLHVWLAVSLGIDPLTDTPEREARIMCTEWWAKVVSEFNRGDTRSTSGKKDRSKDAEGEGE